MLHILGLTTVTQHMIWSLYSEYNMALRPPLYQMVKPLRCTNPKPVIHVLWSRDGSFDCRPGVMYTPNHFVALQEDDPFLDSDDIPWALLDEEKLTAEPTTQTREQTKPQTVDKASGSNSEAIPQTGDKAPSCSQPEKTNPQTWRQGKY